MTTSEKLQKLNDIKSIVSYITTKEINTINQVEKVYIGQPSAMQSFWVLSDLAFRFDKLTGSNTYTEFFLDYDNIYPMTKAGRKNLLKNLSKNILSFNPKNI
jgi:hypothetical protein